MASPTLIFDMDGVLVDSEPLHLEMEQRIFEELGFGLSLQEHEAFVGMAPLMMWEKLREQKGLSLSAQELKQLEIRHKVDFLREYPLEATPGIPELMARLQGAGVVMALASSAPREYIDIITEKTGLRPYFRRLVSADEVANGKPEPDVFLRAADLLDVEPAACTVIEDSGNGVRAALAAGMRCIAYRNPGSGQQAIEKAHLLVQGFGEEERQRILGFVFDA